MAVTEKKPIRILHIINGIGTGGAEKDIISWYRNIDTRRIQFDFLIRSDQRYYEPQIHQLGGRVYQVAPFPRKWFRNIKETEAFFKRHKEYSIIHVHGNTLFYIIPLIIAKRHHIPCRIMHIHSTKAASPLSALCHSFNRLWINRFATAKIACSRQAGVFGFGRHSTFITINNGVNLAEYCNVSKEKTERYEREFLTDNSIIKIGHVGKFLPVKNHRFIVDVFYEFHKKYPSKLFLVGMGPERPEIEKKIQSYGLEKDVIFLGERSDVPQLLHYFDILLFPSLYEGVPLVPIEAQAASRKAILSDCITDEVCITPFIRKLSLKQSPAVWAKEMKRFLQKDIKADTTEVLRRHGYEITDSVSFLSKFYMKMADVKFPAR